MNRPGRGEGTPETRVGKCVRSLIFHGGYGHHSLPCEEMCNMGVSSQSSTRGSMTCCFVSSSVQTCIAHFYLSLYGYHICITNYLKGI